ncbi:glutamate ligase domain-containing protein [Dictyobacter kobayashii]|uniref:Mur ligase C-terminal domain-containing protein n=1 Tax=Dictyobacter kobayashii TaxID=2014872 RepID=A0A402AGC3_9CHLR|nr:cyanophycin synthetase [Dictyobacter kobayashii]GCE18104.1 hypothetical protein KDK_19040 [Dictyobacter kobayashii]
MNADSPGCWDLRARLQDWPGQIITYSVGQHAAPEQGPATFEAYDIKLDGETSFRVRSRKDALINEEQVLRLQLPGAYNIENALAALTAAHLLGVSIESIASTLAGFTGTRRRFDIRLQGPLKIADRVLDVTLVDDYAHHPTAIAATLEATRRRYPGQRIVAVYQPHMYSRTKTFFDQFLHAFDAADVVIIADIFPARERDTGLIHARELVDGIAQQPVFAQGRAHVLHGGSVADTTELLNHTLRSGDMVVIMGAGDIYVVTETLLKNNA